MTNEEAIKLLETMKDERNSSVVALTIAIEALKNEQQKGEWIKNLERGWSYVGDKPIYSYICPFCEQKDFFIRSYCPNCGADMRETDDGN